MATKEQQEREALSAFTDSYNAVAEMVNQTAIEKGWWDKPKGFEEVRDFITENAVDESQARSLIEFLDTVTKRNEGEIQMLIVSELVEALEALRHGNPPDDKVPAFDGVSVELADAIIRIMDYGKTMGYPVAEALTAKLLFNRTREKMHGGKKF
jgi:hypothetical protein